MFSLHIHRQQKFIIHLNKNQMELSYKRRNNGSDTVQISLSPIISNDFHSGICFKYHNDCGIKGMEGRVDAVMFN